MKKDRFDLEQAIMVAWSTCEDIDLIYHNTDNLSLNAKDADILQNQLLGLRYITELRFEKMWSVFEELIALQALEVPDPEADYHGVPDTEDAYNNEMEEYLAMKDGIESDSIWNSTE
jgi:hypothetical protein